MQKLIGRTLGHYRVVEKIGEGGMGEVYRAHDERLDRDVAIKVLPAAVAQDPDRIGRFEREAKAVAKLDHPNILAIHDFGTDEGVSYAVMELLEGEPLRERLDAGALSWRKASEIGAAIAEGLAAAHGAGIIHRDLKPDNIFITSDGRLKILDFGLARDVTATAPDETDSPTVSKYTDPGAVMGTVGYMSPEQVRGEPADQRSDIFSLGSVLYEMATGRRAFARDTAAETMTAILREQPGDFEATRGDIPPELRRIVIRCLEKNPEERFQSARDLAFDLRSVSLATRGGETHRRSVERRTRLRWVAVGGLSVVIAAVAAWWFASLRETLPPTVDEPRIVVLPFENVGSPDDEYFADGITEEITSRLAAVSGLDVISRTSAMYYKDRAVSLRQIGEELDVEFVLEGTIRWDRSGAEHGTVRITPQLISVADDTHLWSERYDRVLEDIFTVQSDIAEQVIARLEATILEPERLAVEARPTENMEAYQAYLLGVQYISKYTAETHGDLAVGLLERAVELDPDFALAHAALCAVHSEIYHARMDYTPERLQQAKASAERALALQAGLPEGHLALGWYYYWGFRDYQQALEEFTIAAEGLPNNEIVLNGLAGVYRRQGRWDKALQTYERLMRLAPQNARVVASIGYTYALLRQYEKAEEFLRRAIVISPDLADGYFDLAAAFLMWDGSTERARPVLESAPDLNSAGIRFYLISIDLLDRRPESALARLAEARINVIDIQFAYQPVELLECMCLSDMGQGEAAKRACEAAIVRLEEEIEFRPHDHRLHSAIGHAYALLGQREKAVRAGELATELMPISLDALDGSDQAIELAKIYSRVGRVEKALAQIDEILSIPCEFSVGLLRLDPVWDPLRDHPRFQALIEKYGVDQ